MSIASLDPREDMTTIEKRVAEKYLAKTAMRRKTAGEVIFRKDNSNDAGAWAFGLPGGTTRSFSPDFEFAPTRLKPLAKTLRSTLAALGHTISAYNRFAKIKSVMVSPDGHLGGRGYIQKIVDMRRQYMNCVEALSALSDTLYDEITAPHWAKKTRAEDPEIQKDISELLSEADEIRKDPEEWADDQIEEEFGEDS